MMKELRDASTLLGAAMQPESYVRHERRDAMEHRRRILQVAQSLFAEQGVQAVSMHQIAKAAGVGQGTLYRRYAHKGELCMDLLREHHAQLMQDIDTLFVEQANATALERLNGLLEHFVAFLEEQGSLLGPVAFKEMQEVPCQKPSRDQHMPLYMWLHGLFTSVLTQAVEQGELAELDVSFTADAILSTLHPMVYHFQRQERGLSAERILQGLRHIYITGVR